MKESHIIKFSCVIQSEKRLEGYLRGAGTVTAYQQNLQDGAQKY